MSDAITRTIIDKEAARTQALLAADVDALGALLSERLIFAHANATYEDKASLLKKMASGNIVYKTLQTSDHRVVDLGTTALLVSRLTAEVTVGGQPRSIDNWTLSVWSKELSSDWQLVAYQPTAIPK
ncbi:nuclear transport factor 2 family protein [Halioxenophilus sp. WMMB6]|uniref:nuclear transport factor 2 family protein n=1 Tax=Halioxenophilus sp. WMMB6 TaxID=3073815 RepID=UPI00295EFC60|nr:nuclear transport factor 2 family protein [Halioxenophilus sp. WMMB6]